MNAVENMVNSGTCLLSVYSLSGLALWLIWCHLTSYSLNSRNRISDRMNYHIKILWLKLFPLDTASLLWYACHKYRMTLIMRKHQTKLNWGTTSLSSSKCQGHKEQRKAENCSILKGNVSCMQCLIGDERTLLREFLQFEYGLYIWSHFTNIVK